jgi:hypothetical protein
MRRTPRFAFAAAGFSGRRDVLDVGGNGSHVGGYERTDQHPASGVLPETVR